MKVVPIRSKKFLGEYSSLDKETVPEGAMFLAGVAFTFLAPGLLFYAVTGKLLPLYLMAANEVLGTALGFMMFKRSFDGFLSFVPVDRIPNVACGTSAVERKKAA